MSTQSLFFEDVVIGASYESPEHRLTSSDIAQFCTLTRDHHPLHTNEAYCKDRGFKTVIAHGLYGLALMEGLKTELGLYETTSIASLGWEKVRFLKPVFAGDTLRLHFTFVSKRLSSKPGRGVVQEELELRNQDGEAVITAEHTALIMSRA
ncbi:MaoC family dehydratase [Acetobacteraceae bacterium H6797]|nr:MaoC family dehydratase [Acetobacteraceae bacterium H6797]